MASHSERMQRRSVVFALCGLLFACLAAAGLIMALVRPVVGTAAISLSEESILPVHTIRGGRRLMDTESQVRLQNERLFVSNHGLLL